MTDDSENNKRRTRWDKLPDKDVQRRHHGSKYIDDDVEPQTHRERGDKEHPVRCRQDQERHRHRDRSRDRHSTKSNGKNVKKYDERQSKRISGYMRAWDDEESLDTRPSKNEHCHGQHSLRNKDNLRPSRRESSKYSERSETYSVSGSRHDRPENGIDGHRQPSAPGGRSHRRGHSMSDEERATRPRDGHGRERKHRYEHEVRHHRDRHPGEYTHDNGERGRTRDARAQERGRPLTRSGTPQSSRDGSSNSSSESSYTAKRRGSYSTESSWSRSRSRSGSRSKKEPEYSRKFSKRKHRHRSRSFSSGGSRLSSEERERKRKKKDKRRKEKSRKKDKEEKRSVLTGKKIKLKVKKDKDDHERDANREKLLQFLNSAYE